ncbi:DUF371 domain-containing protein [Candidatus Woesearchaeota archaeon]|nr:DUF371 domain-containing protein [Candidatus Woesearchaeota archaeon]
MDKTKHKIQFIAHGHENLLATHPRTFEFTKDKHLTKQGDCIIGVSATFDIDEIKKLGLKDNQKILIEISCNEKSDEITAYYNVGFTNNHEMVIRITDYKDQRTFAVKADKSSLEINRELVEMMKDDKNKIDVLIEKSYL